MYYWHDKLKVDSLVMPFTGFLTGLSPKTKTLVSF